MKICYGSDLHLCRGIGNVVVPKCDLLLLAGDIFDPCLRMYDSMNAQWIELVETEFFRQCSINAGTTVLILGNHEHYGSVFEETAELAREQISAYDNIILLDNEAFICDNIAVFGSTLWTDFNKGNPLVVMDAWSIMSDYAHIYQPYDEIIGFPTKNIDPYFIMQENMKSRDALMCFLSSYKNTHKTIVLSHHAPTWACISGDYVEDQLSYAYTNTGFDNMILDGDGPDLWIHGHIHDDIDFAHGDKTRILCNPRGYLGIEPRVNTWKFKEVFFQ